MSNDTVSVEPHVVANDVYLFSERLTDEHSVKRVAMMKRQRSHCACVGDGYRQNCESVNRDLIVEERLEGARHTVFAEAYLDSDFPVAGGAQQNIIGRIGDEPFSGRR